MWVAGRVGRGWPGPQRVGRGGGYYVMGGPKGAKRGGTHSPSACWGGPAFAACAKPATAAEHSQDNAEALLLLQYAAPTGTYRVTRATCGHVADVSCCTSMC